MKEVFATVMIESSTSTPFLTNDASNPSDAAVAQHRAGEPGLPPVQTQEDVLATGGGVDGPESIARGRRSSPRSRAARVSNVRLPRATSVHRQSTRGAARARAAAIPTVSAGPAPAAPRQSSTRIDPNAVSTMVEKEGIHVVGSVISKTLSTAITQGIKGQNAQQTGGQIRALQQATDQARAAQQAAQQAQVAAQQAADQARAALQQLMNQKTEAAKATTPAAK